MSVYNVKSFSYDGSHSISYLSGDLSVAAFPSNFPSDVPNNISLSSYESLQRIAPTLILLWPVGVTLFFTTLLLFTRSAILEQKPTRYSRHAITRHMFSSCFSHPIPSAAPSHPASISPSPHLTLTLPKQPPISPLYSQAFGRHLLSTCR